MRKLIALSLGVALASMPMAASAQQLFDFNGQADLPAGVGGALTLHAVVFDGAPATTTPLPLDFANHQYTIVVTGLVLDTDGPIQSYSGGTIALYEDAGTAADYGNLSTFTDGTALLVGTVTILNRQVLINTIGQAVGSVDWTAGSRINDLQPSDRIGWSLLTGTNGNGALPGFDELWDGKVEPLQPVIENENRSVGGLKSDF